MPIPYNPYYSRYQQRRNYEGPPYIPSAASYGSRNPSLSRRPPAYNVQPYSFNVPARPQWGGVMYGRGNTQAQVQARSPQQYARGQGTSTTTDRHETYRPYLPAARQPYKQPGANASTQEWIDYVKGVPGSAVRPAFNPNIPPPGQPFFDYLNQEGVRLYQPQAYPGRAVSGREMDWMLGRAGIYQYGANPVLQPVRNYQPPAPGVQAGGGGGGGGGGR